MIGPINTALCSFGMSGLLFHAPFLVTNERFNFYAVWERSKSLAQDKYPWVKTYRTYDEMLEDGNIELVIVNTPNYTHYEFAKKALQSGKHVVIEKPFVVNSAEGRELISLAAQNNLILSVYHNRRYDSDFKTVRKVVRENLLGNLSEVEIHYDRYVTELSYKTHKEIPGPGRGALYDLGSHLIDQALQLFGMPEELFADIRIIRPISKVDDYFELILYYNNLRVKLKSSYLVREQLPGYIIHGAKGSFIKPKTNIQEIALMAGKLPDSKGWGIEPDSERGLLHTEINGEVIRTYIDSQEGNYADFFNQVYKAIREGQPVPVDAKDALNVIKIIEAAFQSSELRKSIKLIENNN